MPDANLVKKTQEVNLVKKTLGVNLVKNQGKSHNEFVLIDRLSFCKIGYGDRKPCQKMTIRRDNLRNNTTEMNTSQMEAFQHARRLVGYSVKTRKPQGVNLLKSGWGIPLIT